MATAQMLPKRLLFVVDVSNSMSRFNAWDHRLDRAGQTMGMIIEALSVRISYPGAVLARQRCACFKLTFDAAGILT